jgi:Na+-transporting methylmalonyl-CoA/oxaloacetate decarboxylase gamma subunit
MTILTIVLSVTASVISGMALFFMQRFFKKKAKKDEERDELKRKENVLILKSINAVGKLTYADAIAIRDGKTNGEMHDAMDTYAEVKDELYEYLLEQNSRK